MERPSIMTALDDALNALDRVDLQTSRMYMWMMFMGGFSVGHSSRDVRRCQVHAVRHRRCCARLSEDG